jgi:hypothetical protein
VAHPSADEITTLVTTAKVASVDLEAFGHDMRRLMNLPSHYPVDRARGILWKARRNEPPPTWVAAAD